MVGSCRGCLMWFEKMGISIHLPFSILLLLGLSFVGSSQEQMNRGLFPDGFLFGTASSSYQVPLLLLLLLLRYYDLSKENYFSLPV